MRRRAGGGREEKRGQDGSSEELWLEVSGAQFDAGKMQWSCGGRSICSEGKPRRAQTCSHKQAQPDTYVSHKDARTYGLDWGHGTSLPPMGLIL